MEGMKKQIRNQLYRLIGITAALIGMIAWQRHFIVEGVLHNIYLNGAIVGVLILGLYLCFNGVRKLGNEVVAFSALQEVYRDTVTARDQGRDHLMWRLQRCLKPGQTFRRPYILGHAYDLVIEELLRTKHMRISLSTMQNLVNAIEVRIAGQRSLIAYLSGLGVFLGLIGTFIGLMEMVGSVGGIIGGLAKGDSASAESMKQLIKDLEAPLVGMAQGFSASLFGLGASLIVGLCNRILSSAIHVVTEQFESWLASIVQIENDREEAQAQAAPDLERMPASFAAWNGVVSPGDFGGLAVSVLTHLRRTSESFRSAATDVRRLAEQQDAQNKILASASQRLERLAGEQIAIRESLMRTDEIQAMVTALRTDMVGAMTSLSTTMKNGFEQGLDTARLNRASTDEILMALQTGQSALEMRARSLEDRAIERVGRMAEAMRDGQRAHSDVLAALAAHQHSVDQRVRGSEDARIADRTELEAATADRHAAQLDAVERIAAFQRELAIETQRLAKAVAAQAPSDVMVAALRDAMAAGFMPLAERLSQNTAVLSQGISTIASQQDALGRLAQRAENGADLADEFRLVGRSLEDRLENSLMDISRSIETVFVSYSDILRDAIAEKKSPSELAAEDDEAEAVALAATGTDGDTNQMIERLRRIADGHKN